MTRTQLTLAAPRGAGTRSPDPVEDDRLAGSDDLWAPEDYFEPRAEPVWSGSSDALAFFRAVSLAIGLSLFFWVPLAGLIYVLYARLA